MPDLTDKVEIIKALNMQLITKEEAIKLINEQAEKERMCSHPYSATILHDMAKRFELLPGIKRKQLSANWIAHAQWTLFEKSVEVSFRCSNCQFELIFADPDDTPDEYNYCPCCGAIMNKEE